MQKREMIELLQNIEDESDIDSLLENLDLFKSKEPKSPTIDEFKSLILSDSNFKSFMDKENSKYYSEKLEHFKKNDMQTLINAEVLKRTSTNETEEQKAIRELNEKLDRLEKEKNIQK
ncbi:hypothetical protein RHK27_20155 [Clostridioides difficile]|nr:hypothetical protein [Clostridioides difficile]